MLQLILTLEAVFCSGNEADSSTSIKDVAEGQEAEKAKKKKKKKKSKCTSLNF